MSDTTVINMHGAKGRALIIQAQLEGRFVRIDRKTKWGNPFRIGPDGTRAEVLVKHFEWVQQQPELMNSLGELRGKVLGCWCFPDACHGQNLSSLAAKVSKGL